MTMKPVSPEAFPAPGASQQPQHLQHPHEALSALADGEAQALQAACSLWRDAEAARRAWHSYHLIGDVMRSDELAAHPARDAAFLINLRVRLAAEPVVLAPQVVASRMPVVRRRTWLLPAAAMAGVAVVAGVLVAARVGMPGGPPATGLMATAPGSATELRSVSVDSAGVLRDPRLEELVRQHHASRGGIAVPAPGALRPQSVSTER